MTPSLASGFARSAARHPGRPALWTGGREYTYEELASLAGGVRDALAGDGGGAVCVVADRGLASYAGVLGALLAGRPYIPLNPDLPSERLALMARATRATSVVTGTASAPVVAELLSASGLALRVVALAKEAPGVRGEIDAPVTEASPYVGADLSAPDVDADATAYVIFTSGSTGTPKGVPVSHRNVGAFVEHYRAAYDFGPDDRFSQVADLSFDNSVHDLFVCWAHGACLCVVPREALALPGRFLREQSVTAWYSVPSVAAGMLRMRALKPGAFPSLRVSLFAGEALPVHVAQAWAAATPNGVVECLYGPTETTVTVTRYPWDPERSPSVARRGISPLGRPFPGHQVRIIPAETAEGEETAPGVGELWISGPQVTSGYLNDPERTAASYVRDPDGTAWYRSGDLVEEGEGGMLHFVGRVDHQVKIQGYRIELQEIDHVVAQAAGAPAAASVAWPLRDGRPQGVVSFVEGEEPASVAALLAACRERLPAYMVPDRVVFVEELPRNANAKIDRRRLVEALDAGTHPPSA